MSKKKSSRKNKEHKKNKLKSTHNQIGKRKGIHKRNWISKDFEQSYPKLSKVPVLNLLVYTMYREGWWYSIGLLLIGFTFLAFGLQGIGQSINADAPVWFLQRVPNFWDGLLNGDWAKTQVIDKPGVLTCLLSGWVNFFMDTQKITPLDREAYIFWWKAPMLLFNFLMLFPTYHFLKKLIDKNHALLITGLVIFQPIILRTSREVNPDATVWSMCFLSFLAFLIYLKTEHKKYVIFSGVFFGLGLLSKFAATFWYPMFFVIVYVNYLFNNISKEKFLQHSLGLLGVYLISILTTFILFPATWINLKLLLSKTINSGLIEPIQIPFILALVLVYIETLVLKGKVINYIKKMISLQSTLLVGIAVILLGCLLFATINYYSGQALIEPVTDPNSKRVTSSLAALYMSFNAVIGGMTFFILAGFVGLLFMLVNKKFRDKLNSKAIVILCMLLGIFFYLLGAALGKLPATPRYQIILFPFYASLAAIFFLAIFPKKEKITTSILLGLSIVLVVLVQPFYDYSNTSLNWLTNKEHTWGRDPRGGYKLAKMVNEVPNAKTLKVSSDYNYFPYYFVGRNGIMNQKIDQNYINQFDYLCLSSKGRRQKTRWNMTTPDLIKYYEEPLKEATFYVGTPNSYIKLVKIKK